MFVFFSFGNESETLRPPSFSLRKFPIRRSTLSVSPIIRQKKGLFGVCDGHGPFGHLVSFRVSQTFPYFLLGGGNAELLACNAEVALQHAFYQASKDLRKFGAEEDISFEASGTTLSVACVIGQEVHLGTCSNYWTFSDVLRSSTGSHEWVGRWMNGSCHCLPKFVDFKFPQKPQRPQRTWATAR